MHSNVPAAASDGACLAHLQEPTWRRGRRRRRSPRPAPSPRSCWRPATLLRRSLCHPSARAKASPRWSFGCCLVSLTHYSARRSNVKVEPTRLTHLVMGCRVGFAQAAPEACFTPGARCRSGTRRLPADSSSSPYARPLRASPCDSTRPTCPRGRDPRFRAPPAALQPPVRPSPGGRTSFSL